MSSTPSLGSLQHPDDDPTPQRAHRDAPGLTIDVRTEGPRATLVLHGDLDVATTSSLRACVEALDPALHEVVIDLADVGFVDSTGIGTLMHLRRHLETQLGHLWVTNPSERARFVLDLTGLADHIVDTGPSAGADPA